MEYINQNEKADLLWKAVIEDFIIEFIEFFYPKLALERDPHKPVVFLDKFLKTLNPDAEEGNRRADLLVKVPLKNGQEKWILLHIEVQDYQDKKLARRMFTYYYRSLDKYGVPVEALVIFTDKNKKYRPSYYKYKGEKTHCFYEYSIFKLADYTMKDFEGIDSPIGIVFQTALLGLQRNLKDEALLSLKITLFKKLIEKGYSKLKIKILAVFIRDLIRFKNSDFNRIFVNEVNNIELKKETMGVIETVIQYNREEAEEIGKEIGKEIGREIGEFITKLKSTLNFLHKFKDRNFSNEDLAEMSEVKLSFIKSFKDGFTKKKYQDLKIAIEKSKDLDDLSTLKHSLVRSMFNYGFSKTALVEYFAMKNKVIENIIKEK